MVQNTLRFGDIRRFNLRTRKPEEKPHNYVQNVPKTIRITLKTEFYKYKVWDKPSFIFFLNDSVDFTVM